MLDERAIEGMAAHRGRIADDEEVPPRPRERDVHPAHVREEAHLTVAVGAGEAHQHGVFLAEVDFAYPDLAFVGHATFARANQRWRVGTVRIAPLEKVRL